MLEYFKTVLLHWCLIFAQFNSIKCLSVHKSQGKIAKLINWIMSRQYKKLFESRWVFNLIQLQAFWCCLILSSSWQLKQWEWESISVSLQSKYVINFPLYCMKEIISPVKYEIVSINILPYTVAESLGPFRSISTKGMWKKIC